MRRSLHSPRLSSPSLPGVLQCRQCAWARGPAAAGAEAGGFAAEVGAAADDDVLCALPMAGAPRCSAEGSRRGTAPESIWFGLQCTLGLREATIYLSQTIAPGFTSFEEGMSAQRAASVCRRLVPTTRSLQVLAATTQVSLCAGLPGKLCMMNTRLEELLWKSCKAGLFP